MKVKYGYEVLIILEEIVCDMFIICFLIIVYIVYDEKKIVFWVS